MTSSLLSTTKAYIPSIETIGKVANGATALVLLVPAYSAAKATIRVAADAGLSCLPDHAFGFAWNILRPILKWKTILDTTQIADSCTPKLLMTSEMAALAISATLVSLYLANKCRKKTIPVEIPFSPRTQASIADLRDPRATLVRKPLPPVPPEDKPPAPPSGNYDHLLTKLKNGESCAIL